MSQVVHSCFSEKLCMGNVSAKVAMGDIECDCHQACRWISLFKSCIDVNFSLFTEDLHNGITLYCIFRDEIFLTEASSHSWPEISQFVSSATNLDPAVKLHVFWKFPN